MWITDISKIMYEKCMDDDKKKYWSLIIKDRYIYYYCRDIKDRLEMRKQLTENKWIFYYCKNVNDRSELYNKITEVKYIYCYCLYVKDRPELRNKINP